VVSDPTPAGGWYWEIWPVNPIPSGASLSLTVTADCFVPVEVVASSLPGPDSTPRFVPVETITSSLPDPDSTPNNHVTTEDDYIVLPIILPLISCFD
jgi:hypothetical protein